MGDQSETPKKEEQAGTFWMSDMNQALPAASSFNSPQQNYPAASLLQYQLSPPAYPPGQYQQTYMVAQSQGAYNSGQTEPPQYYPFPVGQQQVDTSQVGYHYGGQVGYRNSPVASPVSGPQFATPMPRTTQPGQAQQYQMPRFQYQLPPQPYHLPLGRATSFPAYTSQTRSPPQSVEQTSPYPVFSPPFLQNVSPTFSDEPAAISSDPENFLPRGPPRKPKQSGFALWVGNLPRDVRLEELKDFFAIDGLESIFLIRKSNCAFVNYKKEEDCAKALATFNDKMFKNVRLVCRLRKSSPSRVPTDPSMGGSGDSSTSTQPGDAESFMSIPPLSSTMMGVPDSAEEESPQSFSRPTSTSTTPSKDRYFIMKSLTKEDLAWSVANKLWATQPHNEKVLNEAFKNSENVYLIFSVNKSGEFFGYARMASEIHATPGAEEAKADEMGSKVSISDPPVLIAGPKTTITPRTNSAPRGKIFEDEVRGTVFWEVAESSDDEEEDEAETQPQGKEGAKWGNPFKVEWIKWDASVQFQRTRTLRNPWNGNREVKISRDGTEIEPTVGSRLLKEFDADASTLGPGLGSTNVNRRMSYPASFRPMSVGPVVYQQQNPQMSPGMTYVSYNTQPMSYNYPPARNMPQQPQNFGGPGQYPYAQHPRQ